MSVYRSRGLVRPPTASKTTLEWNRSVECQKLSSQKLRSVDGLLQLLHWQDTYSLAGRLGLEDAGLLGEWVDTLAGWAGRLLLDLHVQDATKLEFAVLLELCGSNLKVRGDGCLDLLWLQLSALGDPM